MLISIIIALVAIVGAIFWVGSLAQEGNGGTNVAMEDGTQIVTITARGGYAPRSTTAAAGVPTILRMVTKGSLDCSSALTVPSIGYSAYLPRSGNTDIPLPPQEPGASIRGICAMGMYSFTVSFI